MNDEPPTLNDSSLSRVGALLADSARTAMLVALCRDNALPAGELAERAGISASTTSIHLTKLLDAGWITVEQYGRHRYYRLASPQVATLLAQTMSLASLRSLANGTPERERHSQTAHPQLRQARTCYDHLAGEIGVALTDALVRQDILEIAAKDYVLTEHGKVVLMDWGVDMEAALKQRRAFARRCLDWTERRDHLGGALGAAICNTWLAQGLVQHVEQGRALVITPLGVEEIRRWGIVSPHIV